jgi:hypothetical protein
MNYQYLHYNFFTVCRKRRINKVPMLLLIYLRGLYSRFGNIFTWKDRTIMDDLGINRKMLQRSRLALRERGVIDYVPGTAQQATQYLILDSVLAPERVDKSGRRMDKPRGRGGHSVHPISKSYEYIKEKEPFVRWTGMSAEDKAFLKAKSIL